MKGERLGTILQVLMVPLMPMILFFATGNSCNSPQSLAPNNAFTTFEFEYDHMIGYDVFALGSSYADNVYSTCNTTLDIVSDEVIIPATSIAWNSLQQYMIDHAQVWLPNLQFIYAAYLIGIPEATSVPSPPGETWTGVTWRRTNTDGTTTRFTAIFVQTIQNLPSINNQKMLEKTVIHELGHSRGILDHLCNPDGTTQNPAHNDPACVMGKGHISSCTSYDIYSNPKFCPADITFLKKVTW